MAANSAARPSAPGPGGPRRRDDGPRLGNTSGYRSGQAVRTLLGKQGRRGDPGRTCPDHDDEDPLGHRRPAATLTMSCSRCRCCEGRQRPGRGARRREQRTERGGDVVATRPRGVTLTLGAKAGGPAYAGAGAQEHRLGRPDFAVGQREGAAGPARGQLRRRPGGEPKRHPESSGPQRLRAPGSDRIEHDPADGSGRADRPALPGVGRTCLRCGRVARLCGTRAPGRARNAVLGGLMGDGGGGRQHVHRRDGCTDHATPPAIQRGRSQPTIGSAPC